jgi:hypothetical protein
MSDLSDLLRREGQHSGVWFAPRLIEAADTIDALTARVAELEGEWDKRRGDGVCCVLAYDHDGPCTGIPKEPTQ